MKKSTAIITTAIAALLLLVGIWPIGLPLLAIGIYCIFKALERERIEYQLDYQQRYKQYKDAETELDEIAADLKRYQEEGDR